MALTVVGTEELLKEHEQMKNYLTEAEEAPKLAEKELFNSSLAGHITKVYTRNKDARRDSGIEQEMLDAMDAFNGEYNAKELNAITEHGGSKLYMNLTATKCRACASWIKDIMLPAKEKAWRLSPSAEPEISPYLMEEIDKILQKEFANFERQMSFEEQQEAESAGSPPPGPQGDAQPPQPPAASRVATRLREMNKAKRDIEETFYNEVQMIARTEMKKFEKIIEDQLQDGGWEKALGEFIENFTVYPAAFLKGPIMSYENRLTYKDGVPVVVKKTVYNNENISPLDMYPSANATDINDGDLIQHIRFERSNLAAMRNVKGWNREKIDEVLETYQGSEFIHWLWTDIESDKAYAEKRGNEFQANTNIIHGLHFFGKAQVRMLREWGVSTKYFEFKNDRDEVEYYDDNHELEIEAVLVDSTVVKVKINDDPLCRRPYYKASFQSRPGSFWGRSLPHLMRDIQRMCNATARALANNMGLASGPQVEVYIDRLADRGDIEDITPMKIWQLTSDPTGAGGRAIQFTQPSSNAAELLAVYKEFELRADDATGIPRYAYGNERTGGAAQTASGLSMLLESASKGIKDAIRHIDDGLIKPRIAYQFYWNMKTNKDLKYTGDVQVVPIGSHALTMKAAEQAKRLELMQTLSGNPAILEVVGPEALSEIFRTLFEDANMTEIILPSRLEIRQMSKEKQQIEQQNAQQAMAIEQEKNQMGYKATERQIQGQENMHQQTLQLKARELDIKEKDSMARAIQKTQEIDSRERQTAQRTLVDAERAKAERDQNDLMQRRQMAFDLNNLERNPVTGNE